jgi:hypothetical protein
MRQLRPQVPDHRAHFLRDRSTPSISSMYLMEAFKIGLEHDLTTDDAGLIDATIFLHCS